VVGGLRRSPYPFWGRSPYLNTMSLPVPVDFLVYTEKEFEKLEGRFAQVMQKEVRWL